MILNGEVNGVVLGIDYGLKRLGVAVGDTVSKIATPETTLNINASGNQLKLVENQIEKWSSVAVVIGHPLRLDGSRQPMTDRVDVFSQKLKEKIDVAVFLVDERFTTQVVKKMNQAEGLRHWSAPIDDLAAAMILQLWFNGGAAKRVIRRLEPSK